MNQTIEQRKRIGLHLKNRRLQIEMNRTEAHRQSGLTRTQINEMEKGTWNYTVDSLIKLCRVLGINLFT